MFRLLYISTARPSMDQATLDEVLKKTRVSNRAKGLTGLLIFDGKRFLQYLEGEEAAVRALYAKIIADPRHYAVVKLRESHGDDRQFADWDMAIISGLSATEFDLQIQRVTHLVETCDVLTAAELKGFVHKLAA